MSIASVAIGDGRFLAAPSVLGQLLTEMRPEPRPARARRRRRHRLFGRGPVRDRSRCVCARKLGGARAQAARRTRSRSSKDRSTEGHRKSAPYDQILIDGAVEYIPDAIVDQLADGGRLGAALIDRGVTRLIVGRKSGGAFGYLSIGDAGVPAAARFHSPAGVHFLRRIARVVRRLISGSIIAALLAGTASADTLRDALVSAYQANPTLTGQREALKGDRRHRGDRPRRRPAADQRHASASTATSPAAAFSIPAPRARRSRRESTSATLYSTAGRSRIRSRRRKTRVEAGRATLRAVEGDVFVQAVSAYMDVIRDRAIVELNANNVKVLETNLEATQDRFQIGDLTRTDVAQSEARLQLGRSQLADRPGRRKRRARRPIAR